MLKVFKSSSYLRLRLVAIQPRERVTHLPKNALINLSQEVFHKNDASYSQFSQLDSVTSASIMHIVQTSKVTSENNWIFCGSQFSRLSNLSCHSLMRISLNNLFSLARVFMQRDRRSSLLYDINIKISNSPTVIYDEAVLLHRNICQILERSLQYPSLTQNLFNEPLHVFAHKEVCQNLMSVLEKRPVSSKTYPHLHQFLIFCFFRVPQGRRRRGLDLNANIRAFLDYKERHGQSIKHFGPPATRVSLCGLLPPVTSFPSSTSAKSNLSNFDGNLCFVLWHVSSAAYKAYHDVTTRSESESIEHRLAVWWKTKAT